MIDHLSLYCLHPYEYLPASLSNLAHLRTLGLTHSSPLETPRFTRLMSLTALAADIPEYEDMNLARLAHLPAFATLSLSNKLWLRQGGVGAHPFSLAHLPSLKALEFEPCSPPFDLLFPPESSFSNLERLLLKGCEGLEHLPDDMGERLPRLRDLSICDCKKLSHLPEQFTALSCLEQLAISSCSIVRLPENFGMLPALKKLSLLDLQIARLPESFHQLAFLEAFHLSHCTAHFRFPAAFGDLTALRSLYIPIAPNLILPDDIGGLTNLHTLHFSRNYPQELLPSSFMQLTSLTRLELVDCAIVQLPGDTGRLSNLRELTIQLFTSITEIPDSLTDLVNLEVLKVLGCRSVSSFPTTLSSLARLKELALAKLPQLPQLLPSLPRSLEILSLGTYQRLTPFLEIPALPNLRRLSLISVAFMRGMVAGMALPAVEHVELSLVGEAEDLPLPLDLVPNLRSLKIASAGRLKSFPKKPVPFNIIFQLMDRLEIRL
ncbi:unnamed protein product [Closterium sp. Naga37s-1]|nr:unnamed protein product [Closterium sp. Naga37s-1]